MRLGHAPAELGDGDLQGERIARLHDAPEATAVDAGDSIAVARYQLFAFVAAGVLGELLVLVVDSTTFRGQLAVPRTEGGSYELDPPVGWVDVSYGTNRIAERTNL